MNYLLKYTIINMSSLSSYYIFSSILFLLLSILSFIVFTSFEDCTYTQPHSHMKGIFLIIGLINTFIFVKMLFAGLFINYFSNKTPEDLRSMNFFFVILSIMTKLSQKLIKILHMIKFLFTIFLSIFIIVMLKSSSNVEVKEDTAGSNNTTSSSTPPNCTNEIVNELERVILIAYITESISYFVSFILFGVFKSFITEESFIYNPEFPNQYCCTILIFHKLGP